MKRIALSLLLVIAATCVVSCTKDQPLETVDDICSKMDDEAFKNFCYNEFDKDGDHKVSMEEAARVRELRVNHLNISSLKGIEYFTAITWLVCSENNLTTLDLSNNKRLNVLYCSTNHLASLKVSGNTKLEWLDCVDNQLTSLDVSNNTELQQLSCTNNQLSTLDVSKNTKLIKLLCANNPLTALYLYQGQTINYFEKPKDCPIVYK